VLHISKPMVTLFFLEHPVDFGAIDGQPVYALFMLISPTVGSPSPVLAWPTRFVIPLSRGCPATQACERKSWCAARKVETALGARCAGSRNRR